MRLWHKELITVLPNQQLLGQWREIFAIYRDYIREKNSIPKKSAFAHRHPLVKYVNEFDISHLLSYAHLVLIEMHRRSFKVREDLIQEIQIDEQVEFKEIFKESQNAEYLEICYYNLLEKYRAKSISKIEWDKIETAHLDIKNRLLRQTDSNL